MKVRTQERLTIETPLGLDEVKILRAGNLVLLNGEVYLARDATHKRLIADFNSNHALPFNPEGAVIYYAGPSPTPPGEVIGSIGPTTSRRMDRYLEFFLQLGVRATIGKGSRENKVKELLKNYLGIYFIACGGAAAYLTRFVVQKEVLAYPELGAQALVRIWVKDFPLIVAYDAYGGDLFEQDEISNHKVVTG